MAAIVIDGNVVAEKVKQSIPEILGTGPRPKLAILCPESPAAEIYMGAQVRRAASLGFKTEVVRCGGEMSQTDAEAVIGKWNMSPDIHGIFILQPFPEGFDADRLVGLIHPLKDVEGIHPYDSALRYHSKMPLGSCTALAVMEILDHIGIPLRGLNAVVVGNSKIVGRPVSMLLLGREATVSVCHKATAERGGVRGLVENAELLVVAAGVAECIPGLWIKPGAIVIDVGVNRVGNKVVGDVEFDAACARASHITPVRGGVGPVTAMIGMRQLALACSLQQRL